VLFVLEMKRSFREHEDLTLMKQAKCTFGTIKNALLHIFAQQNALIEAKPLPHTNEVSSSRKPLAPHCGYSIINPRWWLDGVLDFRYITYFYYSYARERIQERLGISEFQKMDLQTVDAYRFGKSKRQIKKTSAYLVDEIEQRHNHAIVLIY